MLNNRLKKFNLLQVVFNEFIYLIFPAEKKGKTKPHKFNEFCIHPHLLPGGCFCEHNITETLVFDIAIQFVFCLYICATENSVRVKKDKDNIQLILP